MFIIEILSKWSFFEPQYDISFRIPHKTLYRFVGNKKRYIVFWVSKHVTSFHVQHKTLHRFMLINFRRCIIIFKHKKNDISFYGSNYDHFEAFKGDK